MCILQPGSQKRSVDSYSTRGSNEDLNSIVVYLRDAAEEFVGSHRDRLKFVELSVLGEAGGGDLDKICNIVLGRRTAAFVCLLRHCNTTAGELGLDRIPKSVGYHVRSERGSRDNDSLFELGRETNAESVRGGVPRSIDCSINSNLHRGDSSQPVQSLY